VAAGESAPGLARSARRAERAGERDGDDAEAVDEAAASLFAIFEAAREQGHTRLSSSQLQALLAVERDEGLNLGALADTMGVILSSASRLCDRLVAAVPLGRGLAPAGGPGGAGRGRGFLSGHGLGIRPRPG